MNSNIEKVDTIQKVAELYMQGHKETEIAKQLSVSIGTVKNYLKEWEIYIRDKAEANPDLLEHVLENTVAFLENYDYILKEAWEVYEDAKAMNVAATRLQSLKLIHELTSQKARLVQLLGPKSDTRGSERARRAERVNRVLSDAIRTVISDCDICRPRLWNELQEIFTGTDEEKETTALSESSEV
jgi:predicted transcriptional regulator